MKQILPHIALGIDEIGRVILEIDDYELFDFIDDYLTEEFNLPSEAIKSRKRLEGEIITMYFSSEVTSKQIENSLTKLAPTKIEAIYNLNNS